MMTLVALLAVTTHAWAQEQSETIATTDYTVEGTHFTISNDVYADSDGMNADGGITVTSKNGEIITKVVISCTYHSGYVNDDNTSVSSGTKEITNFGETITVTGVNASTFTFTCSDYEPQFGQFVVYYTEAPTGTPFAITWSAATPNTASIDKMPAGNVTVSVDYFAQAELAESGAPAPIPGVLANTDAPIVTPGTVANIGTSEVKQGTLMYYVSQTPMTDAQLQALTPNQWSDDVPTAADLLEGAAYVYYYIQGAEPATIAERTDANTCSDGDILAANVVNVTVLSNKFDLTLNPANVNTIDATDASKGTVTVKEGTGAAVDKTGDITADGKLKAVKMDSEVKLKANNGYKFRKVEVKKDKKTLTITDGGQFSTTLDITGCTTWDEVITKNSGMIQKNEWGTIFDSTGQYSLLKGDGDNETPVNADNPFDPNATDYKWAVIM